MSDIVTSKKRSLFQNYEERANGELVGTFNTNKDWKDINTDSRSSYSTPLIKKEILNNSELKGAVTAKLAAPVTHRLEDVARLTKMIATPQGITWEAHTAAAQTIQNNLEAARSTVKVPAGRKVNTFTNIAGKLSLDTLKSLGKAAISGIGLTASTLAQTAVAGTGEHQTPFLGRAYLRTDRASGQQSYGKQILGALVDSLGVVDGNSISAALYAQNGELVPVGDSREYAPQRLKDAVDSTEYKSLDKQEIIAKEFNRSILATAPRVDKSKYYGDNYIYKNTTDIVKGSPVETEEKKLVEYTSSVHRHDTEDYSDNGVDTYYDWKGHLNGYSAEKPYSKFLLDRSITRKDGSVSKGKTVGAIIQGGTYSPAQKYDETSSYERFEELKEPDIELAAVDEIKTDYPDINLIPFAIASITPEDRYYLYFQANLDSFDDNYTGNWDSVKYLGRAENFYVYNGFTRDINFAFKVVARRRDDLVPIYRKLNYLVGTTAPTYASEGMFMRGTLTCVTIGDYLKNQYGFFKSVKFQWDRDIPWEIDVDGEGFLRVPHMLTVSVGFTPIHNFNVTADNTSLRNSTYFGGNLASDSTYAK